MKTFVHSWAVPAALVAGLLAGTGCGRQTPAPASPPVAETVPAPPADKKAESLDDVDALIRSINAESQVSSDAVTKDLERDLKGLDNDLKEIRGKALAAAADDDDVDDLIKNLKAASKGGKKDDDRKPAEAPPPKPTTKGSLSDAVARLEKLGAKIYRDSEKPGQPVVTIDLGQTKATDADLAVLPAFMRLRELNLLGTAITDAGLAHIKGLTSLERLSIQVNFNVTDAGLANIKDLTNLTSLSLAFTKTTDATLAHLGNMKKLRVLNLCCTNISDVGLRHLKGLRELDDLKVDRTGISDAGLAELSGLTSLRTLGLSDTNITGAGLAHLKGLVELRHLGLKADHITLGKDWLTTFPNCGCNPRIDDDGLKHLKGLRRLEDLYLDGNNITDAGLAHLAGLSEMQTLTVENTKVTVAGLARVRKQQADAPKPPSPTASSPVIDDTAPARPRPSAPGIALPRYFDQLDLTNEQLEKMKKIAAPYDAKIAELRRKLQQAARVRIGTTSIIIAARNAINKVTAQRTQALEGVLTDKQKDKLRELRGQ